MTVNLSSVYKNILVCSLIVCTVSAIAINQGQVSSNPNLETSADLKIQKTSLGSNKNTETGSSERSSNAIPDTSNKTKSNFEAKFPFDKLYKDWKENSTCFEGGVIQLIDNMDNQSIPIYQDIILLEKTSDDSPSGSDPSETLMTRFDRFLRDHSIRVRIPNLRSEEQQSPQEKENYAEFPLRALATTDASEGEWLVMVTIVLYFTSAYRKDKNRMVQN